MPATFQERLRKSWRRADSALCVGLDPRLDRLPAHCLRSTEPMLAFCRSIVDATAHTVCVFKPQYACFAAVGAFQELRALISYIHAEYPDIPVILDAKRGDIGDTAELYAAELFDVFGADAATVSPYLGWDALEPYTRREGRGTAVLCHTSNAGSPWLQEYPADAPIYLRVAAEAAARDEGNLMLVVGATFPEQLASVRAKAPKVPLLVPGIGAQGGDADAVFANGLDADGAGLVVSASRSVIFASEGDDWARAAGQTATTLRDDLRRARDAALATRGEAL